MEVLQAYYLNEVNHGNRTHNMEAMEAEPQPWNHSKATTWKLPLSLSVGSVSLRDQNHSPCPCRVVLFHLRPEPLCAQRSGEQASETRCLASRHLLGYTGNQVFGSVFCDCSLPQICEIDYFLLGFVGSSTS